MNLAEWTVDEHHLDVNNLKINQKKFSDLYVSSNCLSAIYIHTQNQIFVIIVSTYDLAPNGAQPSADTVLAKKLSMMEWSLCQT